MKVDLSFESNYSIQVIEEIGIGERYYYPEARTEGGKDGILVEITSFERRNWFGIFAFGEITPKGLTGIYSMPDSDKFCVVAKGAGYIVSADNPKDWQEIKAIPIMDVRPITSQNLLVFADYTELVAYGKDGIKWRSERLAYDSFKIIEITEKKLKGEFWNIRKGVNDVFEVDLSTGLQKGGARI